MEKFNRQRQRVLVVGHLPPPQEGTAKLTKIIVESGYLGNYFQIRVLSLLKRKSVTNRGKFGLANITHNIGNILKYSGLILRYSPDIIYMPLSQNTFGFFRDSIFILGAKFLRKKVCVHFHGGSFDLFYRARRKKSQKYIRFILRKINRMILLAKKFQGQFLPFIAPERISFLYNCVPEISLVAKESQRDFSKARVKKILFVGYLSKAKGALDVVRAVPMVTAEYRENVEFILCGQAVDIERNIVFIPEPHFGYSKIKELIINKNIDRYVKIYPEVIAEEKDSIFSQADIFVLPSYSEGCALVVLEAMSFGLPIITTPVGALEEMLIEGENCFFVEPGDIRGLAEKILFLLSDSNAAENMGRLNRKLVREKYNADIFLRNLKSIWDNI